MKPSEKLQSDILRSLSSASGAAEPAQSRLFRDCVARNFGQFPESVRGAIALGLEPKRLQNAERAASWLASIGSIFAGDYDGNPLSDEEWREVREIAAAGADELDLDTLSYVLSLVMDHKAL
jgi:hypothetical protein